MAETTINALQVFDNGAELSYLEKDGEILFTAEEVGRHLGYGDPAKPTCSTEIVMNSSCTQFSSK